MFTANVILNLKYQVIKADENDKMLYQPVEEKPKGIKFNLKKMIKKDDDRDDFKKNITSR